MNIDRASNADTQRDDPGPTLNGDDIVPERANLGRRATRNNPFLVPGLFANRNPLVHRPIEDVVANAQDFAKRYGIKNVPLIIKAAALAKDRTILPKIGGGTQGNHEDWERFCAAAEANTQDLINYYSLNEQEEKALTAERSDHLLELLATYRGGRKLYRSIIVVALAATLQGWDQVGVSAANLWLALPPSPPSGYIWSDPLHLGSHWETKLGLINATPFLAIAVFSSLLSDPLNHAVGRPKTILIGAVLGVLAPIISVLYKHWLWLVVWRLVLGVGMGLKEVTVPIYAAEISPTAIRGTLVMSWQVFTALGIFLGSCSNLICNQTHYPWQLALGSAFLPALVLSLLVLQCPESPRYLMKKKEIGGALASLHELRPTALQAARDLYEMKEYLEAYEDFDFTDRREGFATSMRNVGKRYLDLWTPSRPREFWATLGATTVMIAQQFCGINIVINYAPYMFQLENSETITQALWLFFGIGAVNFVFTFPAFFWIEKVGRRGLILWTFPIMFVLLLVVDLLYYDYEVWINKAYQSPAQAAIVFLFLFVVVYSPGLGPVPFTYSAEVFQLSHREVGMGWAVAVNNAFGALLLWTFAPMYKRFGAHGSFMLYVILKAIIYPAVWMFVRETKQKSLESLNHLMTIGLWDFLVNTRARHFPRRFPRSREEIQMNETGAAETRFDR